MSFRVFLKVPKMPESQMVAGRPILFQTAGAETTKECWLKSEETYGQCRVVVVPGCSALSGWCQCSSHAR